MLRKEDVVDTIKKHSYEIAFYIVAFVIRLAPILVFKL